MKLLFFSSDSPEVELAKRALLDAGIPCKIRNGPVAKGFSRNTASMELWIKNNKDCHKALMLCVQLGVGFSRRPTRAPWSDSEWEGERD